VKCAFYQSEGVITSPAEWQPSGAIIHWAPLKRTGLAQQRSTWVGPIPLSGTRQLEPNMLAKTNPAGTRHTGSRLLTS
jgi:hypothetical protein